MSLRDALISEKCNKEISDNLSKKAALSSEQEKADRFYVWAVLLLGSKLISELRELGINMECTSTQIMFSHGDKRRLCLVPNWLASGYEIDYYNRNISYSTGCGWTAWALRELTREKLAYNIAKLLGGTDLISGGAA